MPPAAAASSSQRSQLSGRTSPSRPSHAHLVTLPINNPTLLLPAQPVLSPLYGLPGVTTSSHSLSVPAFVDQPLSPPSLSTAATEGLAPHLASAEAHLGRMTLTAPDNMMRRRAQEREKERRARKIVKKQERAREAMVALAGPSRSLPLLTPPPATTSRAMRSRPVTPHDPGESSSSGGAILGTAERISTRPSRERSSSATRPQSLAHPARQTPTSRSTTVQATQATSSSDPTRPRARDRPIPTRVNSGHAAITDLTSPTEPSATTSSTAAGPRSVRRPGPHRGSARPHESYQQVPTLSLSGVEVSASTESDSPAVLASFGLAPPNIEAEASPPPFPEGSTRPASPPRPPPTQPEDYTWTSEEERTWREYRRRVPDSPPPAFLSEESEDEGTAVRQRDLADAAVRSSRLSDTGNSNQSESDESVTEVSRSMLQDRRAWDEDLQSGLTFEQRFQRLEMRRRRADREAEDKGRSEDMDASSAAAGEHTAPPVEPTEEAMTVPEETTRPLQAHESVEVVSSPLPEVEAGERLQPAASSLLVTTPSSAAQAAVPVQTRSAASHNLSSAPAAVPHIGLSLDGALTSSSLPHQPGSAPHHRQGPSRPSRPRPKTIASSFSSVPTAIRPRTTSASLSRYRDDAAAAAERRELAWGITTGKGLEIVTAPPRQGLSDSANTTVVSQVASEEVLMPGAFARAEQPVEGGSDTSSSSSSEAEWAAEAAAFEALRRAAEGPAVAAARDSDEDSNGEDLVLLRSPMTRLQDVLPKAPPPLVLGRTRGGGLAYDASDSEDSGREDDDSDSDESLSDEDGVVRVVNPRWALPTQESCEADRHRASRGLSSNGSLQRDTVRSNTGKRVAHPTAASDGSSTVASHQHRSVALTSPRLASQPAPSMSELTVVREETSAGPSVSSNFSGLKTQNSLQRRSSTTSVDTAHSTSSLWQGRFPGAPPPPSRKPEMSDRLKDLFDAPLATSSAGTFEYGCAQTSATQVSEPPNLDGSLDTASVPRPVKVSVTTEQPDDQQLRREALKDIARLQGGFTQGSSLTALERLLTSSLRAESASPSATALGNTARLSRQSAISSATRSARVPPPVPPRSHMPLMTAADLSRSSSFINPRSSFAPLPRQTRLPTITDATRHFPPTREDSSSLAGDEDDDRDRGPSTQGERVAPRLPPRPPVASDRISALLARFEGTTDASVRIYDSSIPHPTPVIKSPATAPTANPRPTLPLPDALYARSSGNPSMLRRRPPPPPPPSAPSRKSNPLPPRFDPPAALTGDGIGPATFSRSPSYPQLFRTDSERDRARRVALDALIRNEEREDIQDADNDTASGMVSSIPAQRSPLDTHDGEREARPSIDALRRRPLPLPPGAAGTTMSHSVSREDNQGVIELIANGEPARPAQSEEAAESSIQNEAETGQVYVTDLDVVASRLEGDPSSFSNFDDIALIQDFLGPALPASLSPAELSSIPLGIVEVEKRRVTREGRIKTKLACLGLRVDRCGICLGQFREGQGAYVLGKCLHAFHGRPEVEVDQSALGLPSPDCAREWFRRSRTCPTCRVLAVESVDVTS